METTEQIKNTAESTPALTKEQQEKRLSDFGKLLNYINKINSENYSPAQKRYMIRGFIAGWAHKTSESETAIDPVYYFLLIRSHTVTEMIAELQRSINNVGDHIRKTY